MTADIFIARQPILDVDQRTFGYELLYRSGPDEVAFFEDPDEATQAVIERAYLHWGMERLIGDRFGMINASARLLRSGVYRALPPEGIIIELREDEPFDDETLDALLRARRDGYHIGLDNVGGIADLERSTALAHASMVKVDLRYADEAELPQMVDFARRRVSGVMMTAEKVQTVDQYRLCVGAGFDLFQGHFFAKPDVLKRSARPANAAAVVALLSEIQRHDIDIDRIEALVGSDATLAYRLLSVVNSSAFGLDRRVDSLRHAIVLLGVNQVRQMAMLLALSATNNSSEELLVLGATRAKLLSKLVADSELASSAFTVGVLSVTDALYNTPMTRLIADLPVTDQIEAALVAGEGELGRLLSVAKACEEADGDRISSLLPGKLEDTRVAYGEAAHWANALRNQIADRPSRHLLPSRPREALART
ncbi:MAG: HDOD domain-containing protein [Ilumatobacter sp.]|uniref:EAL and HDOD domain-containing protein n=1 Tax=Ilumatobacter sp. TaxID=1967498 RepID=UPI00260AC0F6|nr:HDOD domain-containing protein [Ilumatobacter sp.]MDJ0767443.1 HDOD domain-containing protein [Ilumatobacter sp.]